MKRHLLALATLVAVLSLSIPVMRGADDGPTTRKSADDGKGWVQIFNGKDLTGWRIYPKGTGHWRVEDGVLIGSKESSHLFNEWCHYRNFRYRVEAMINDHGNSGQYFRTQFGPGFPRGYEAQINSTHSDPIRTGSLYPSFRVPREERRKLLVFKQLHKPDEWFTQEVIAVGNHIVIKVNGQTTVDFVDKNNSYMEGHFALQQHDPGTVVKFRKIEVMELPDTDRQEQPRRQRSIHGS